MKHTSFILPLVLSLAVPAAALAQDNVMRSAPTATPVPRNVPDAADVAYPGGAIRIEVDASDVRRGLYRVTQTIPVAPGTQRLTLLAPEWLPGYHAPRGPLAELVDVRFTANGRPVSWTRDPVEVFAFHLDLPAGTREVVARLIHTSPLQASEGRITMTPEMLNLQWEKMTLYPAGHYVRRIRVRPSVTFPQDWTAAVALDGASRVGNRVTWAETDYETLVDSPIFAGAHFRKWDLGNKVTLNVVADKPAHLELKPADLPKLKAMVDESLILFNSRHFDRYEFLVALTDKLGGIGLEHHRSSENTLNPDSFTKWAEEDWDRNVLAHEIVHSWNGKFRRPEGLWTPDYREPMRGNLLWLYEGQTQFWGYVVAARSGLQSKEMVLAQLANDAGYYAEQPGRGWRAVEDTTHDPIFGRRKAKPYSSLSRGEDYYSEGSLVWLEADQIIREGTGGRRSLDDFAAAFFGINDGDWGQVTYTFEDIVATLNGVHAYDWAGFLRTRLQTPDQPAPLRGIERGGYRLVWKDEPNAYDKARMANARSLLLFHSLGLSIDKDARVTSVRWEGPGFDAGIVTGTRIIGVNGASYDHDRLNAAITAAARPNGPPVTLVVERNEQVRTVAVPYRGGLRWPWLEPVGPGEQGLDRLLAPRRPGAVAR